MTKEAIEERHVLSFWQQLDEFPGIVPTRQNPPEPDFFIEADHGLIGLEHTRLVRQKDDRGVDMKAHNQNADHVMKLAAEQFSRLSNLKLYVSASFRCDHGLLVPKPTYLANRDIQPIAAFITDFVARHIPPPENHYWFEEYDYATNTFNFSEEHKLRSMDIWNLGNKISQPCWTPSQAAMIPRMFESTAFTSALAKKNTKPKNYRRNYHQLWLLMVEDQRNLATYFDNEYGEAPEVTSSFDRVFVFRYASEEIIELKVNKADMREDWIEVELAMVTEQIKLCQPKDNYTKDEVSKWKA